MPVSSCSQHRSSKQCNDRKTPTASELQPVSEPNLTVQEYCMQNAIQSIQS